MTRDEAIAWLEDEKGYYETNLLSDYDKGSAAYQMAIEALKQPERKKGKWEWDAEEGYWCSECKKYIYGCIGEIMEESYKFCPFCGSENEENQWIEG